MSWSMPSNRPRETGAATSDGGASIGRARELSCLTRRPMTSTRSVRVTPFRHHLLSQCRHSFRRSVGFGRRRWRGHGSFFTRPMIFVDWPSLLRGNLPPRHIGRRSAIQSACRRCHLHDPSGRWEVSAARRVTPLPSSMSPGAAGVSVLVGSGARVALGWDHATSSDNWSVAASTTGAKSGASRGRTVGISPRWRCTTRVRKSFMTAPYGHRVRAGDRSSAGSRSPSIRTCGPARRCPGAAAGFARGSRSRGRLQCRTGTATLWPHA